MFQNFSHVCINFKMLVNNSTKQFVLFYIFYFLIIAVYCLRHIDRYLKNDVSKIIVHVINHVNFQLYRAHPDGVI